MLHSRPLLLLILVAVVFSPLPRARAEAPQSVEPFPLSQVRLREGLHRSVQQRSARRILEIDPQRVLSLFRLNAQLPTEAEPLGGWESEGHVLRGAFAGHYLSICAQLYVVTEDPVFKERLRKELWWMMVSRLVPSGEKPPSS